ncbi:MAG: lysylphosphatidylglycerol synthase domain-containing protein [Candidatus Nitrosoglobus sp.]
MIIVAAAGLALAVLLVVHQGLNNVVQAVAAVGWGILAVVIIHLPQIGLSGLAWRILFRHAWAPSLSVFIGVRWIREAVDSMLPMVVSLGGAVIGARLLTLRGLSGSDAGASVIVDLTMEAISQFLFTLLGLVLLVLSGYHGRIVEWAVIGLVVSVLAVLAFLLIQRSGLFRLIEKLFSWLAARWPILPADAINGLHDNIQVFYRSPRTLVSACNLHFISWLAGTFEVWLILYFIGVSVTLQEALILESLGQAIRSAGTVVPGSYGIQEGGYMVLGTLFGLAPEVGLALSIVKRLRDVILGIPGLITWQMLEGRRL